jgi:hypothetical protein
MTDLSFLVADDQLAAFYSGVLVALALGVTTVALIFSEYPRGRLIAHILCVVVPSAFIAARVGGLSFHGLNVFATVLFLVSMAVNRWLVGFNARRVAAKLERDRAEYARKFESEFE